MFIDKGHRCGEELKVTVEVAHDELGSRIHGVELGLYDRNEVICSGNIVAAFPGPGPTVDDAARNRDSAGIETCDLASPAFNRIDIVLNRIWYLVSGNVFVEEGPTLATALPYSGSVGPPM